MPEIGEGIGVALARLSEDKCVICGKKHDQKKQDQITPTGWTRSAIAGVGGNFSGDKLKIYPASISPPTTYRSEGHHCLAFSAFIVDARTNPKDRFAAMNHYLKAASYDPNNKNNVIDLPGRKKEGDTDEHANFKEFEKAALAGKPLQLHIGGHAKEFLGLSSKRLLRALRMIQDSGMCEEPDDSFKQHLKEEVVKAEDEAFKLTANAESPWIAHPGPLKEAEKYVLNKHATIAIINYPKL